MVGQQTCKWVSMNKARGTCSTQFKHKGQLRDHLICKIQLRNRQQLNFHKKNPCEPKVLSDNESIPFSSPPSSPCDSEEILVDLNNWGKSSDSKLLEISNSLEVFNGLDLNRGMIEMEKIKSQNNNFLRKLSDGIYVPTQKKIDFEGLTFDIIEELSRHLQLKVSQILTQVIYNSPPVSGIQYLPPRRLSPNLNNFSLIKQFLVIIVKTVSKFIIETLSSEQQFNITYLEPVEQNTLLFKSNLDCTGASLVLHYNPINNINSKYAKLFIFNLVKILKTEVDTLVKKFIYGANSEECKKTCCFGLICGEQRFNLEVFEDPISLNAFDIVFRLGSDEDFVFLHAFDGNPLSFTNVNLDF
ncbi:hypothetical protein HK099_006303 [Clydaea vesicula]|uniref:Uncharacterized protein n=1 Tax=Clydaea vesicula TaxID=447962 RepID=A0AAD5U2M2_9FUNG|nr:hypothetical protein HK099_006303 [Clydaea vesicula]